MSAISSAMMTMYGIWSGIASASALGGQAAAAQDLVVSHRVVAVEMPHADASQQVVPLFHLLDGPRQYGLGLFHVGDDRVHQVRNAFVRRQLDHLRVDHQHLHLVRAASHQDRQDQRVEADALARAGAAGDQEVRHLAEVDDHRPPADVLAEKQRDAFLLDVAGAGFDQLAQADHHLRLVRDFHADGVLAGDRRDNTHGRHAQRDREVVLQRDDFVEPQSSFQSQLELRDDRAGVDLVDLHVQAELLERLFERHCRDLSFLREFLVRKHGWMFEHFEARQDVLRPVRLLATGFELRDDLLAIRFHSRGRIDLDRQPFGIVRRGARFQRDRIIR